MRFVTTLRSAQHRLARATAVVLASLPQVPMLADMQEIGRWFEAFPSRGRLELDYGGLAALLDLTAETSVADLAVGLEAVQRGDGAQAAAAYERVAGRWRQLQLRETAS